MLSAVFTLSQQCTLPAATSNCPNPQNLNEVILLRTLSIIHLECSTVKLCLNINSIHNIIRTSMPVSLQVSHTFLISLTHTTCNIHCFSESDHPLSWQQVSQQSEIIQYYKYGLIIFCLSQCCNEHILNTTNVFSLCRLLTLKSLTCTT
jgi:hypothetical protein